MCYECVCLMSSVTFERAKPSTHRHEQRADTHTERERKRLYLCICNFMQSFPAFSVKLQDRQ